MPNTVNASPLIRNRTLRDRVSMFLVKTALGVYTEDIATAGHTERLAFAAKVLAGDYDLGDYMRAILSSDVALADINVDNGNSGMTDINLETYVASHFNAFAGFSS